MISKLLGSALVLNSIILVFSLQIKAESPVDKHGSLQVKDGMLCNQNGEQIVLRGMSFFWSQWMPRFYNEKVVDRLVDDWNVNVLRIAMGVEFGGYLEHPKQEKAKVFEVVDACIKKGIYVIVDWHDHNAIDHEREAIEFFKEIATRYGSKPNLIYETYNEPLNTHSWSGVKAYHEAVVKEIRSIDPDNLIILGSPSWDQEVDKVAESPLEDQVNIAASFHFYASDPYHQEDLRKRADIALKKGLCLFVSEWGVSESSGNGAFDRSKTDRWLDWMETNKLSWCAWSIGDKAETSAVLRPGASGAGEWKSTDLTPSGKYLRQAIRRLNDTDKH